MKHEYAVIFKSNSKCITTQEFTRREKGEGCKACITIARQESRYCAHTPQKENSTTSNYLFYTNKKCTCSQTLCRLLCVCGCVFVVVLGGGGACSITSINLSFSGPFNTGQSDDKSSYVANGIKRPEKAVQMSTKLLKT